MEFKIFQITIKLMLKLSAWGNKKPMINFRRTKFPKFRVGAENFVRRKIRPPKFCPIFLG